jgi:N-methylhydantoinase A
MAIVRVGVDTGGTFTDLMAASADGKIHVTKTPSTPGDDALAFMGGMAQLGNTGQFVPGEVESISHGTTVALNAVLQRNWAPIGLIVTKGYREILEIGRQTVPGDWGAIYTWVKPPRVVPLENVVEVDERLDYLGKELAPLDADAVRSAARWYRSRGIGAVAICFLHSYKNNEHERLARDTFSAEYPECYLTISSEILPEFREYERAMTTCLNAVLMPLVSEYLEELTRKLAAEHFTAPLLMMKSSGGLSRHSHVIRQPIYIAYSGPSAGVLGMAWLANKVGEEKVLTYDMGGTSTDVAVVEYGRPVLTTDSVIDIYPMKAPSIDLVSIGAGGGSIATLGTGNRLRVGPESAGAVPGPVCYGRGGAQVTVTDANLVLGRIPAGLLGGRMQLDVEAAAAAVSAMGDQLALDLQQTAYGILEIAAFNMAGAMRQVSVRRGRDPREYTLFAYGGAGPLHASQLASLLGISRIVIPQNPGLGSCVGLLAADIREGTVQTYAAVENTIEYRAVNAYFADMESRMRADVAEQGVEPSNIQSERGADLRYVGMASELSVTVPAGDWDAAVVSRLINSFHDAYERTYGYSYRGEQEVELINLRVTATGVLPGLQLEQQAEGDGDPSSALVSERVVYFGPDHGTLPCPVYDRSLLQPGNEISGPAIVEDYDSTILVPPRSTAKVDGYSNLVIRVFTSLGGTASAQSTVARL